MTEPRSYTARVLAVVIIAALVWLAWRLRDVVIVVFGGVLVATALRTLAQPLHRYLRLPPVPAVAGVVLLLLGLLVLGSWLIGDNVSEQVGALRQALPQALEAVTRWLDRSPIGQTLLEVWNNATGNGEVWSRMAGLAKLTLSALAGALLILVVGVYLAADPALYRRGLLHLLPPEQRSRVEDALRAAGHGLSRWLLGQGVAMLVVGSVTATGLWLLGIPLALALGVIAGVLEFVPFFGAIVSSLLVVLLAFTQGPQQALYAALLMLAIQQTEGYVLIPFVQRWSVRLPPVLPLVAVMIFSLLFGLIGVLFAVPLMVVVMILVQRLYVRDVIESDPPAS